MKQKQLNNLTRLLFHETFSKKSGCPFKVFFPADEYTYFLFIKIKKMISLPFSGNKKETRNIKIIIYIISDSLCLKADVQIHLFY